ncbi:MAG: formate dehydrogenase accessory sulfurtransferase FdhD [Gemmatimonadaceae bacterium]
MPIADKPLSGIGYAGAWARREFIRVAGGTASHESASIADEVPIALVYNGRPHVVMMGTPLDLEDLAFGFTRTEGIAEANGDIERVDVVRASHGIELQIQISARSALRLAERSRALVARTGCGLCGIETINDALRVPPQVAHDLSLPPSALWRASGELTHKQTLNADTNAVHAAAWASCDGAVAIAREDVGRHNALDKTLGALERSGVSPAAGFLVVTSRASYEMVQKAASAGVELLAAVSRPTGLAIRFAEAAGMTLVGLLRGTTANVYCGQERVIMSDL